MNRPDLKAPPKARPESVDFGPLLHGLEKMAALTSDAGDEEQSGKFRELASKLAKGYLTLAFCGHFSAGKSTLVNALSGAALLPSSPVPTSANVVTIVNGQPSARIIYRDKDGAHTQERAIPIEELHGFAIDGEGVASIDVSYPVALLGDRTAIVDTPGVDSTDAAHRAATESALHLADIVFYVTDYNHVLSDVNFRFLRALSEWGKPAYLIVNQVDKHRDSEVAFGTFRENLLQAMETWKIHPAGVLFLSLRQPDHPLSQWDELLSLIAQLQPLRSDLMIRSALRSAVYLAERFRETVRSRHRTEREDFMEKLGDEEEGAAYRLTGQRAHLTEQLNALRGGSAARGEALRAELDRLLANASLTPAETRDKAADVLQSLQHGFKAGFFAGAAKTEAERDRRLALLADDFNRQIAARLNGHVRDLLRREAREAGWDGEEMESSIESAFLPVTPGWLRERVKPGMGADGQATLQYAAEISSDVKAAYRKGALGWSEQLDAFRRPARELQERRLTGALEELKEREEAADALAALDSAERAERDRLISLLPEEAADFHRELQLPKPKTISEYDGGAADKAEINERTGPALAAERPGQTNIPPVESDFPFGAPDGAADMLDRAAGLLCDIPALAKTAEALAAKAARYRNRRFTIALFGAFSAGKSSFANALAGLPALPVSPNPTTATINRIVAPTEHCPHGTAWVTMKTREVMLDDVRHSLRRLGIPKTQVEAVGDHAPALLALGMGTPPENVHPKGKPHLAFLRAAEKGWERYGSMLDTRFAAEGAEYRRYAADEQASCFVAEIDLSVDSPLTRRGAVLVDTPGADSINARHTGVAFEYIKNADAILFVTYYNHAFTEADRQFLNQLGSVKDVFELDKMFFLINAADLAASDAELQEVKEHVETQLLKHGIRRPRLFGVSSLNGLQAKQTGDAESLAASGLAAFERAFRTFAENELGALALVSARKELERADKQLHGWLQSAGADSATREAEAKRYLRLAQEWRAKGIAGAPDAAVQPLLQETSEQLYHLRQRVYYRYGEHFQNAFHPSVLQDDGRDLRKLLSACWDDLKRSVGEDLLQELRSAGLRLERALAESVNERLSAAAEGLASEGFSTHEAAAPVPELPMIEPFAEHPQMDAKRLGQSFKSPKHFFEQEGAKALREQTAELLFRTADEWLADLQKRWNGEMVRSYQTSLRGSYADLADELAAYAQSLGESLHRPEEERQLAEIRARWKSLISNHV